MILRPFLYEDTACASYLFGCLSYSTLAVVDPHVELVDRYLEAAERAGAPITAVFETHVQADHVSGLPALVAARGATVYPPAGADVAFAHSTLADGDVVELGNTLVRALATPGHAPAHHAYVVSDLRRGTEQPWLVFTGDSLLVGLNALVGAMVGLERSVLPLVGEHDFGLRSKTAILAFVLAFGIAKAC